jgi:hypothetical protein
MSLDLQAMRDGMRKPLGVDESDLPNEDADLYLNRAYWEVMDKFPFREKERAGQFETTIGIRNYEIPKPVEAVRGFAVVRPSDFQHIPLDQMNARETEYHYQEGDTHFGLPRKYLLENCYVRLWPTPDLVYTIVIRKWTILAEIVMFGGVWRAFFDYKDFTNCDHTRSIQRELISTTKPREQKEFVDLQHAGVVVLGRDFEK